jgi:hypothetical protein
MPVTKGKLLESIYHDLGCDADDWMERSEISARELIGGAKHVAKAAKDIQSLTPAIQADLDQGKLNGMEPAQVAAYAIRQIAIVTLSLQSSSKHLLNASMSGQGEIAAYKRMRDHLKAKHGAQAAKNAAQAAGALVGSLEEPEEAGPKGGRGRVPGTRPESLTAKLKAEDPPKETPAKAVKKKAPRKKRAPRKKKPAPKE